MFFPRNFPRSTLTKYAVLSISSDQFLFLPLKLRVAALAMAAVGGEMRRERGRNPVNEAFLHILHDCINLFTNLSMTTSFLRNFVGQIFTT